MSQLGEVGQDLEVLSSVKLIRVGELRHTCDENRH